MCSGRERWHLSLEQKWVRQRSIQRLTLLLWIQLKVYIMCKHLYTQWFTAYQLHVVLLSFPAQPAFSLQWIILRKIGEVGGWGIILQCIFKWQMEAPVKPGVIFPHSLSALPYAVRLCVSQPIELHWCLCSCRHTEEVFFLARMLQSNTLQSNMLQCYMLPRASCVFMGVY